MASRRTRIKGIANIPQRRKNTTTNEEHSVPQEQVVISHEHTNLTFDCSKAKDKELQVEKLDQKLSCVYLKGNNSKANEEVHLKTAEVVNDPSLMQYSSNDEKEVRSSNEHDNQKVEEPTGHEAVTTKSDNHKTEETKTELPIKLPITRRKFIKPTVSAGVIRKGKQVGEKDSADKTEYLKDREPNESDTIIKQNKTTKEYKTVVNNGDGGTLDEVHFTSQIGAMCKYEGPADNAKKLTNYIINPHNSDTEYPPPPPSPSKINRSRIKAIPRLGYRKTSFSASESEDESRRQHNRNRNDSVCSTASGVPESITECMSPQRPVKEYNTVIQKKCSRTEQSRKLAEARREFQRRFGADKPDRQRLTMIDLIFYNPTSNPMTNDTKSKAEEVKEAEEVMIEDAESEKIDDPVAEPEPVAKSDEENEMPVPQIKIGPSGEIILDEKSLVIENTVVAKQKEQLQKTQLVDGDFDTGYGVYKRQKKAKDWTHSETLRFYKALNTIGTDFTLMCELFPRRNRRELKMKFKKEERVNRGLIDRAVLQPCQFDYVELKHEVDMEEKELKELQNQKDEEQKLKKEKMERIRKRKAPKEGDVNNTENPSNNPPLPPKPKLRKPRKPKMRKLTIDSILDDSDADESDVSSESESEEYIMPPLKPTRSGRTPKVAKKFDAAAPCSIKSIIEKNKVCTDTKTANIEPGSIMIITEKGQNGEPVYKLFMVTPNENATPLKLTSDLVSKALDFKMGISAQNIMTISANVTDDEAECNAAVEENNITIPAEENITIPADENITTLKESVDTRGINNTEESNRGRMETSAGPCEESVNLMTEGLSEDGI